MDFLRKNILDDVRVFIDTNPHACAMKDKDSIYVYSNASYARLVGFKHAEDFLGRTDFDVPSGQANCAPLFRAQDQDVIHKPHVMKVLDVHPEAEGKWHALFTTKTVFFDPNGEIGGIFFQLQDITSQAMLQFSFILGKSTPHHGENTFLNQFSYMFGAPNTLALTPRQEQILFFLMRRHSVKKIALALGVSLRTLYSDLEHLKIKFNASTINELVDKSITQGCVNVIPNGLSYCQMSAVLQEE
jgi:DNA-binding CsgD family transcriptional regulator